MNEKLFSSLRLIIYLSILFNLISYLLIRLKNKQINDKSNYKHASCNAKIFTKVIEPSI